MRKLFCTAACLAAALLSVGAVHGDLVVMTTQVGTNATFLDPGVPPVVSSTDLADAASGATIAGQFSTGAGLDFLIEGTVGVGDTTASANLDSDDFFTITLDTSVNTLGYDIDEIFSVAGWTTGSGGRSNQGYEVTFNLVGGGTTVIAAGNYEPNNPPSYWTTVSLTDDGLGTPVSGSTPGLLATGVESITFNNFVNANEGADPSIVVYREFDVLGTATVAAAIPEPSSLALLGLCGLAVINRRRRG